MAAVFFRIGIGLFKMGRALHKREEAKERVRRVIRTDFIPSLHSIQGVLGGPGLGVNPQVKVHGLDEFKRGLAGMDKDMRKMLRDELAAAAQDIADDAASRAMQWGPKTASGYKPQVRMSGPPLVVVRQSRRKTTGLRPDFGGLQMTEALEPALEANEGAAVREIDRRLGEIIKRHGF